MSSNFFSKPVDVSKYGVIYGGAQKNIGPAGVTIVIVREDLLGKARAITPTMLDYAIMAENESLYNTPPCYAIYVCGLVFERLLKLGGLSAVAAANQAKAAKLYDAIQVGCFTRQFWQTLTHIAGVRGFLHLPRGARVAQPDERAFHHGNAGAGKGVSEGC